jgi:hypothetical protein
MWKETLWTVLSIMGKTSTFISLVNKQGYTFLLILLCFFGQGLVCYAVSGLKLNIIEWQDVWLPGEIWKVSEDSTMTFTEHNWGSPQKTPIRILTQPIFRPVSPEYNCTVLQTTATPTHLVVMLLNGSYKNRTFCFSYRRQSLGNGSNSQKLSPALPVRHIILPIFTV